MKEKRTLERASVSGFDTTIRQRGSNFAATLLVFAAILTEQNSEEENLLATPQGGAKPIMTKLALLVVLALCATVCPNPASAQDLDQAAFNNAMITRSQIKHNTGGALDPLSVRARYQKRKRAAASRKYRSTRRYRTSRYARSTRRSRPTYRTVRRTTYRSRQ